MIPLYPEIIQRIRSCAATHLLGGTMQQASPLTPSSGPRQTEAVTALCSWGGDRADKEAKGAS